MHNSVNRLFFAAGVLVILLCQGPPVSAQCSSGTPQFGNVSLQRGNPFQAEYSTTVTPAPLARMALTPPSWLHSIARDSEGRVREERAAGKFKVKTADGAETEQEQHLITICDPVNQKLVRLDTLNKTATVMGPRLGFPRPGLLINRAPQSFCSSYFKRYRSSPHIRSEELGSQNISGVEAQGLRTWMVIEARASSETQSQPSYQDHWCSEELGAFVMQAFVSPQVGRRNETLLKNIERREPDASLFEIPADYTIEERTQDSSVRSGWRPLSPNSTSTPPQ